MRNQEALEKEASNSEIDIIVAREDFQKLEKIIEGRKDCREIGFKPDTTHPLLVQVVGKEFELKLDFQKKGIGFCGTYILGEDKLLDSKTRENGVYILEESMYFLHLFTHSFLYHGEFGKYREELHQLVKKQRNKRKLVEFYEERGEKFATHLENQEFDELLENRKRYMAEFLGKNPLQNFDFAASLVLRAGNKFNIWKNLKVLNPWRKAPLVSFMGVDKSGKTTLSDFTAEEVRRWNYDVEKMSGSIFQQYPPMSWINKTRKKATYNSGEDSEKQSYDEKVQKEMNSLSHLEAAFRLTNATITSAKIWIERQKGNWVITDRYPWDMAFFISTPPIWEAMMKNIIPKPNIPFHVEVSEETLEERNCELNRESRKKIKQRINDRKEEYRLVQIENEELEKAKDSIRQKILPLIHDNKLKY